MLVGGAMLVADFLTGLGRTTSSQLIPMKRYGLKVVVVALADG